MRTIVRTSPKQAPVAKSRPACASVGVDPELFFAHALSTFKTARAKAICRACPLRAACLEGALERGEEYGVWGGTDEDERRLMKRGAALDRIASAA
ncbi:WhiB family transcriptional regulator (plasmid) [Streptomyces sp. DSM 116496]|uniref:WhiB family transcriptional regulator n=1 Tax=Streptomyces stoeckheimensis TaxID=3344656 RepID=UPI0038B41829